VSPIEQLPGLGASARKGYRVALFLPSLEVAGAERVMVTLARGLAKSGLSVDVVVSNAAGGLSREIPSQIQVVDLAARGVLGSLPALVRYLRRQRPDALMSTIEHANVVALWAAWLARTRTRTVVRAASMVPTGPSRDPGFRAWALPLFMRWTYPWADHVIAPSKAVRDDLAAKLRLSGERIEIIYNPVDLRTIQEEMRAYVDDPWFSGDGPPVILAVGRLVKVKDHATLLRAFAQVKERKPARLVILGEGPERPQLEALAEQLHVDADVSLPGFVENPFAYMARATVFVQSSAWEGLPNALIQALACGCPVVSTDCQGGAREVLGGGRFGRLVPSRDPSALADALVEACMHPTTPPGESLEAFQLERVVEAYRTLLTAPDATTRGERHAREVRMAGSRG